MLFEQPRKDGPDEATPQEAADPAQRFKLLLESGEVVAACRSLQTAPVFCAEIVRSILSALNNYAPYPSSEEVSEDESGGVATGPAQYQENLQQAGDEHRALIGALAMVAEEIPQEVAGQFRRILQRGSLQEIAAVLATTGLSPVIATTLKESLFKFVDGDHDPRALNQAYIGLGGVSDDSKRVLSRFLDEFAECESFEAAPAGLLLDLGVEVVQRDPSASGPVLIERLDDVNALTRAATCFFLAGLRYFDIEGRGKLSRCGTRLFQLLDSEHAEEREQAAHAIGYMKVSEIFSRVCTQEPDVADSVSTKMFVDPGVSKKFFYEAFVSTREILSGENEKLRSETLQRLQLIGNSPAAAVEPLISRLAALCESVDVSLFSNAPEEDVDSQGLYGEDYEAQPQRSEEDMERVSVYEMLQLLADIVPEKVSDALQPYIQHENEELETLNWLLAGASGKYGAKHVPAMLMRFEEIGQGRQRQLLSALYDLRDFMSPWMDQMVESFTLKARIPPHLSWDYGFAPQRHIVAAAARSEPQTFVPQLIAAYVNAQNERIEKGLLLTLHDIAYGFGGLDTLPLTKECVSKLGGIMRGDGDRIERLYAVYVAGAGGESGLPLLEELEYVLDDSDAELKLAAVQAIGRLGAIGSISLAQLVDKFDDFPVLDNEYFSSKDALAFRPVKVMHSSAENGTQQSANFMREYEFVTEAVQEIIEKSVHETNFLIDVVSNTKSTAMRTGILRTLERLLPDNEQVKSLLCPRVDEIGCYLDAPQEQVRAYAASLIGLAGEAGKEFLPKIRSMAQDDPSQFVRTKCHEALGRLGKNDREVLSFLLESFRELRRFGFLEESEDSIGSYRAMPEGILSGLVACAEHFPEARDAITLAFSHRDDAFAQACLKALQVSKDFSFARPFIEQGLRAMDQTTRQLAVTGAAGFGKEGRDLVMRYAFHEVDGIVSNWAAMVFYERCVSSTPGKL